MIMLTKDEVQPDVGYLFKTHQRGPRGGRQILWRLVNGDLTLDITAKTKRKAENQFIAGLVARKIKPRRITRYSGISYSASIAMTLADLQISRDHHER